MFKTIKSFIKDESGLETVEYAVMLALIAAALIGVVAALRGTIQGKIQDTDNAIQSEGAGA